MHPTAARNAFAKWETLDPPANSISANPAWMSPSPPYLRSKVPSPDRHQQLQPPPTPKVGTDCSSGSFAVGDGGRVFAPSPPLRREALRTANPLVVAALSGSSDSIAIDRTSGSNDSTKSRVNANTGMMPSSGSAPYSSVDEGNHAKPPAALSADTHVGDTVCPSALSQVEAPRSLVTLRGCNRGSGPSALLPPARSYRDSGRTGSGSGLVKDDAESLLARLAVKAKQAAAVALSASVATGGITRLPPSTPVPTLPPQGDRKADVPPDTTGPVTPGTGDWAPVGIGSASNTARARGSGAESIATVGRGYCVENCRDERSTVGAGGQGREVAAAPGAVAGGARLAELCKEDKTKVARLMQDLIKLRAEKDEQKARFERLRRQNEEIVKEMAGLKVKFGQSMQLIRKYQSIIQDSGAAGGGVRVSDTGGTTFAGTRPTEGEAAAKEIQALRETLRVAEETSQESARKAEAEAAAERAIRNALAEELRRARVHADELRQQLDHHLRLEAKASPVTARERDIHEESLQGKPDKGDAGASNASNRGRSATVDEPSAPRSSRDPALLIERERTARPGTDIKGGVEEVIVFSSDACPTTFAIGAAAARGSEGGPGGMASTAELAAVKEQVETLKQQLVMVGVQQLALTGIPTGAALLSGHGERVLGQLHHPAADSAAAAAHPSAVDGHLVLARREAGKSMAENVPLREAQTEGDRRGKAPLQQQDQKHPSIRTGLRREEASARKGQGGSVREVAVGGAERKRSQDEGTERWRDVDGGIVKADNQGEKSFFEDGELSGGGLSSDAEEGVGWWAQSADKLMLAAGETTGQKKCPGEDGESDQHGRKCYGSRCDRADKFSTVGASVACGGQSCEREGCSDPDSKGPGAGAGHDGPPRGSSSSRDHDTTLASAAEGALDPVSRRGKLRVSWSSISLRSSGSELMQESVASSPAASTSNRSSGSPGTSDGRRSSWRRRGDESDAMFPTKQQHKHQHQQQQQQQQQPGGGYDMVSPSSFSSSSATSSVFGLQKRRAGVCETGRRIGVSVAALSRRHRLGSATSSESPAGGKYHPRLKTRATTVPGSRRRVIVGGGSTAARSKTADCPRNDAAVAFKPTKKPSAPPTAIPAATVVYRETTSASARCGSHNSHRRAAVAATGVAFRGSDSSVSNSSRRSGGRGGELASSCVRRGYAASERVTTVPPERVRSTSPGTTKRVEKAADIGLGCSSSSSDERWWGSRASESRWNRGLETMLSDDDTTEALATLGGDCFFDGSLLDLIDDLEEFDSRTHAATAPKALTRNTAAPSDETAPPSRWSAVAQGSSRRVSRGGDGRMDGAVSETRPGGGWNRGGGGTPDRRRLGEDTEGAPRRNNEEDEEESDY